MDAGTIQRAAQAYLDEVKRGLETPNAEGFLAIHMISEGSRTDRLAVFEVVSTRLAKRERPELTRRIDGKTVNLYSSKTGHTLALAECRTKPGNKFFVSYIILIRGGAFIEKPRLFGLEKRLTPSPRLIKFVDNPGAWWAPDHSSDIDAAIGDHELWQELNSRPWDTRNDS